METDFFNMDFSELFMNKHGEIIFNNICDMIKIETTNQINNNYIPIVFKLAFLEFFELPNESIIKMMDKYYPNNEIDFNNLLSIHRNSINEIKKLLKATNKKEK